MKRYLLFLLLFLSASVCSIAQNKSNTKQSASKENYSTYLFVYFTGNENDGEAIRFAISDDGYNFRALNHNQPVLSSKEISLSSGVRDPHILRRNDGKTFYMVATDMVAAKGWNSNRGIVLMKSDDLIHWTSSTIYFPKRFSGQDSLLRVWAPQTIYDPVAKKYMVYFSMKHGMNDPDKIYYAYANKDFTDLETEPKQLFFSPTNGASIDADIIPKGGKYYMFFKTEGEGAGIKIAISDKLTEGYMLQDKYVQQTKDPVEGPGVYKLNGGEGYVLMYDVYTKSRYQFTLTQDFKSFTIIGDKITMKFHPRHGTVMPITADEKERLIKQWGISDDVGLPAMQLRKDQCCLNSQDKSDYWLITKRYGAQYADVRSRFYYKEFRETLIEKRQKLFPLASSDGSEDIKPNVTVLDINGRSISNNPPVELKVIAGPGEFPTGGSIKFEEGSDIRILDGQASIEMRLLYAANTTIQATSPGLQPAEIQLHFTGSVSYKNYQRRSPHEMKNNT